MYWYYKITYESSEKLVKTSNESCEIWLKSKFGNKWEQVDKPYPIWDEHNCEQLTEDEYIRAIGNIDLNNKFRQLQIRIPSDRMSTYELTRRSVLNT